MEMKNEIWKPVKDYEGLYEVSNFGRVRSLDMVLPMIANGVVTTRVRHGVLRKFHKGHTGYDYVMLRKQGHPRNCRVHRIVAQAFIPNPNNLPEVNHKDENKSNNRADNLEWCTSSYNHRYGTTIERAADKIRRPVFQLSMDGQIIKRYNSVTEAEKATGVTTSTISGCCKGSYGHKSAGGYRWRYADD